MSKVIYTYKSINFDIQCQKDEKLKILHQRFKNKLKEETNQFIFLYNGNVINEELTFNQIANEMDKKRNEMNIIVIDIVPPNPIQKFIISKDIICQDCYENSFINIKKYKFDIKCKNGHEINDILIKEFDEKQKIDISKIICNKCNENRAEAFDNKFYICITCNIYLCPLCKSNHDKKHKIIDFDNKFNLCNKHCFYFVKFCNNCKTNICMQCQNAHKDHDFIDLGDLFINKENMIEEMNKFKNKMDTYINDLSNNIFNTINNVKENMNIYYKICNKIINNYDEQKLTYQNIQNIIKINNYNINISKEIDNLEKKNSITEKLDYLYNIYQNMNTKDLLNNLINNISEFDSLRKNINEENGKYLLINSEINQGNYIIKYYLNKKKIKYIELITSKFEGDLNDKKYKEGILENMKNIMKSDNILILGDFSDFLYECFSKNIIWKDNKKYIESNNLKGEKIFYEVNKDFHAIIFSDINQSKNLELIPHFKEQFEKQVFEFKIFLDKKDLEIVDDILNYIDLLFKSNQNTKLKIDFNNLLINCNKENIQGLLFKVKNDLKLKNISNKEHWIFKEDKEYEENIIKSIFMNIVPIFSQDFIVSLINSAIEVKNEKYNLMNNMMIEIYKNCYCYNFENFLKKINSKRNIIYSFSKDTNNLINKNKVIENKFGKFEEQYIEYLTVEKIKKMEDLINNLNLFLISETKKILIISFKEDELKYIYSIYSTIDDIEKKQPKLKEKIIIFIINKNRRLKEEFINNNLSSRIPYLDENYNQIFIDNLHGEVVYNYINILGKSQDDWKKDYLISSNFIEKNINEFLNNIDIKIILETNEINNTNIKDIISKEIIKNNDLKNLLLNNLIIQKLPNIEYSFENYKNKQNFTSLFEAIDSEIKSFFINKLFNILYYSLKNNILFPIIQNYEFICKNNYLNSLIEKEFQTINFNIFKMSSKSKSKIIINNFLKIPKSQINFRLIIGYVNNELKISYLKYNDDLGKKIINNKSINTKLINNEINRCNDNLKNELNKYELFTKIFEFNNEEVKMTLLNDYLYYFLCQNLEESKNLNQQIYQSALNFLKLSICFKFFEIDYKIRF